MDEIAHHYATAAELVCELGHVSGVPRDIVDRALDWLTSAAQRAADQQYMRSAVRLATRGIELCAKDPDRPHHEANLRLLLVRAAAYAERRELAKARADLEAVLELAPIAGRLDAEAEARRLLGYIARLAGNLPAARGELSESVRRYREAAQPRGLARALRDRAFVELFGGDLVLAEELLEEAEHLTIEHSDEIGLAWVEWHRAWLSFVSGRIDEAEQRLRRASETMTHLGDRGGLGWVLGLLAFVRFFQGATGEAENLATSVLAEASERGDDWAAGMMQALLANLRLWQGRTDEALKLAEEARVRFRRMGEGFGELLALGPLARANVALGRAAAATRALEEMQVPAEQHHFTSALHISEAGIAVHLGEPERAIHNAERALDIAPDRLGFVHEAFVAKALGLAQAGYADDALVAVDQAAHVGLVGPYLTSVRALVHLALGDAESSLADARATLEHRGASYLDRVYGGIAAAFAHARLEAPAAATKALDDAAAVADGTGDVVAQSLVELARSYLDGRQRSGDGPEFDQPFKGWRRLFADVALVAGRP
jgi:tetratricopeptide (TPR) repeat protein